MSIKRTIITTIVALALVAMVAPGVAQGVTIEELLAQIAQLQAQLLALQQAQGGTSGTVPANCVGVTFTRALTVGSTGSDVKCLQSVLNLSATTKVAATGAGSPGSETSYFGSLTLAAVRVYQAEHGWTPANQVGPLTRQALNASLAGGTTGGGTTPPVVIVPTGAGLTVALATDNPTSGTIVDGQALYPLAKLTLTNGDNAEVKLTGLKLKRIGVSADASVTNMYLFDGATRLTDGAAVSSTIINFNNASGLFTVPSMGSKTISVLADVNGTASETFGVQVVASTDVTSNASSVKGTYPISSNLHTLATGTLAGVEFNATTTPSSAATIDPQNDYTVWQNSIVVTTRAVDMTRISFRKTGSVKDADLQNFRLYVDGVQTGSAIPNIVLSSNNESLITFDLTGAPKRMEAGTRVIKLLADIIGGSSLTFTFNLWNAADVTVVDSQYLANVLPDLISDASFTKRSTAIMTIGSGSITITKKTDSPSGNIVNLASNALLAKFELKAAGEKVKIETLYISANVNTSGVSGLRNGAIYANGVQIGSTTTLYDPADTTYDYTTFNLGSSLIVEPGNPVILEVRADIFDTGTSDTTNSIVADSTIQVTIEGSSSWDNATGQVSATTLDVPATDVSGNSLTVKTGGLTLSANPAYTAQTVVAPVTAYKLASFNLNANTTEAVNLTAINVAIDDVSSYASNLYVKYGTKTTSNKPTVAASNSWSINEVLAAGATIPIEVYIDVSSSMISGDGIATVDIDGTTVSSAASADSTAVAGQTINFSTGTFAAAFASTPQNQVVRGGQEVEIGRFKFTSSYNEYTIQEIKIDPNKNTSPGTSSNAEDAIVTLSLKDGSTVLATESYNAVNTSGSTGGYYFTGLSIPVAASTSKTLTVVANFTVPSATAGNSGLRIIPALTYVKYMNPQGTVTEITDSTGDLYEANSTYVYRTIPTLSLVSTALNNTLINGQVSDLYKFKVAAPSYTVAGTTYGDVHIKQFKVAVSWSDGGTDDELELESLKLLKDGVDITSSVSIQDEDLGISVEGAAVGVTEGSSQIVVVWDGDTEDTIPAGESTTYTIRGTPQEFRLDGTTDTATDSVSLGFTPDAADVTFGSTTVDFIGYLNTDSTDQIGSIISLFTAAAASTSAENANLIWSDGSAVAHSASTTAGTGDWTNSYLLNSVPSVTWTK